MRRLKSWIDQKDTIILEPTSGEYRDCIGIRMCRKGYRLVLTMPDTMSKERRILLRAYGADLVLTPGAEGMPGAIKKAEEMAASDKRYFIPQQFLNPPIPKSIEKQPLKKSGEIQTVKVDILVAGVGTAAPSRKGEALKARKPSIQVVAVEPDASAVLSGDVKGAHAIQGIGAGFIPEILNTKIYDEIVRVKNEDALVTARRMAKEEGLLVGISSGAAMWAALQIAKRSDSAGKLMVVIIHLLVNGI